MQSSATDLPPADAQYLVPCYNTFRVVSLPRPSMMAPVGEALKSVVTTMAENMTETWTISELYSTYLAASGTVSRRQFVSNITTDFGDKLLLLHMKGCESVVGFKASLGQFITIAKKTIATAMMTSWRSWRGRFAARSGRHLGLGTTISLTMLVTRSLTAPVLLFLN